MSFADSETWEEARKGGKSSSQPGLVWEADQDLGWRGRVGSSNPTWPGGK